MNTFKPTYFTILISLALFLTGCTNEDKADNSVTESTPGNKLVLRIGLVKSAEITRATSNPSGGEYGDGWRVGKYNENNVYNVYLYKYSSADGINASDDTPVTLLAQEKDINFKPTADDADIYGNIEKEITFNVGAYRYVAGNNDHFIAAVNTDIQENTTTLGKLRNELITHTYSKQGSQMKDYDNFTMANAHDSKFIGGSGKESDPYVVSIDVERTAARLDFAYSEAARTSGQFRIENGQYIYKVLGESDDEVRLTHVRATNVMQHPAYLIKRLALSDSDTPQYLADESNPATKYVVEPTTWSKSIKAAEDNTINLSFWFRDSWYMNAHQNYLSSTAPWFRPQDQVHSGSGDAFTDGTTLDEKDHDWHYYVLDYANENTMLANQTLHNYTTGLILKATYVPKYVYKAVDKATKTLTEDVAYTAGTTFWRWHDIETNKDLFFSNQTAAEDYQSLFPHSVVFAYDNAQCYYNVWLRHENIVDDPTTTMMEFAIVRNNIYRVCVEFSGIGMPDIPDDMVIPENIRMFIYVRKWNLIQHPTIEI